MFENTSGGRKPHFKGVKGVIPNTVSRVRELRFKFTKQSG